MNLLDCENFYEDNGIEIFVSVENICVSIGLQRYHENTTVVSSRREATANAIKF